MRLETPRLPFSKGTACPDGEVVDITEGLTYVDHDGFRVIFYGWGTPLYRIALSEEIEIRYVAVALHQSHLATQEEIATSFGHSVATQRRWERRFEEDGLDGLRRITPPGRQRVIGSTQAACVRKWFGEGESNREMARRLGVDEGTIRNTLRRLGLERKREEFEEPSLPFRASPNDEGEREQGGSEDGEESLDGSECPSLRETRQSEHGAAHEAPEDDVAQRAQADACESQTEALVASTNVEQDQVVESARTWCPDPLDRSLDRLFARLGLLDDAEPIFAPGDNVPRVGIFLAVPLLVSTGVVKVFEQVYGSIGPAFYGLRTTLVCLFFLALLRIKRPEHLKEHSPQELGRVLGLDRAPEMKTLRGKLKTLAARNQGMKLMSELAQNRAKTHPDALGTLYFDGHVIEYHGKHKLSKTYVTQRRLCVPASTHTWVNDFRGQPVLVVPAEMNEGLTKVLLQMATMCREFVGPDTEVTLIFDRGGWSLKLFVKLIEAGFHIITYRKGRYPHLPRARFEERRLTVGTKEVVYHLHDAPRVRVGKSGRRKGTGCEYVWMRQVTRLRPDGKQTAVLTTHAEMKAEDVLYAMFNRWRQENYFKYMGEEFALNAMLEYAVEPVSPDKDRPNPECKALEKQLRKAQGRLAKAERVLGERIVKNEEARRPSVRDFKHANADALLEWEEANAAVEELKAKKNALPKRVPASDLMRLKQERRLVADAIKMTAYQIESDLFDMLSDIYARHEDEGRTLLHAAFQSSGKVEVLNDEIRITLAPQSSPHRTRAISQLCAKLNEIGAAFPGTNLQLTVRIDAPEPLIQ
jgi:transposase